MQEGVWVKLPLVFESVVTSLQGQGIWMRVFSTRYGVKVLGKNCYHTWLLIMYIGTCPSLLGEGYIPWNTQYRGRGSRVACKGYCLA